MEDYDWCFLGGLTGVQLDKDNYTSIKCRKSNWEKPRKSFHSTHTYTGRLKVLFTGEKTILVKFKALESTPCVRKMNILQFPQLEFFFYYQAVQTDCNPTAKVFDHPQKITSSWTCSSCFHIPRVKQSNILWFSIKQLQILKPLHESWGQRRQSSSCSPQSIKYCPIRHLEQKDANLYSHTSTIVCKFYNHQGLPYREGLRILDQEIGVLNKSIIIIFFVCLFILTISVPFGVSMCWSLS